MKLRFCVTAATLLATSMISQQASASLMLDASYQGLSGQNVQVVNNGQSRTVQAGLMQFNLASNTNTSVLPFDSNGLSIEAFCVEFTQDVKSGWQSYSLVETAQVFSSAQSQAIERLYTAYHDQVGTQSSNAAFQLALWEVVHETSTNWSLSDGDFKLSSMNGAGNLANGWLSSLDSIESQFNLYVLTNADSQNQLVFSGVPLNTTTPVPVPATLGLFGLGALLLLRRRKN
ncbi:PEP-CTERM sorting domain-containing protein [Alkalimonas collagenimarina]|uniref:PEP-CTERM sorting domain-containing protein n=1 Tax=Alkalimonas collagenimarina TaxID=400390 RepID=A0ABT9GW88_9GAMM|nr:PEP-CTERM sorting domain-containing protein [Alkalimonas collagenimarina]MDP4535320.1 PEP-CTERM sorting domain-containing protein [Alkalimonas collagenimarina]